MKLLKYLCCYNMSDTDDNIDWSKIDNKIKLFSLENKCFNAKVVSIYDGDTVKVVFKIFGEFFKFNCRLINIDTPEIRCKCKIQKKYGYVVRDKLREKILNKVVKINCHEFDKYGRLLIEIIYDNSNINQWMIDYNYAFQYDGGTKSDWSKYLIDNNINF